MQAAEHRSADDFHTLRQAMAMLLQGDRQTLGRIGDARPEAGVRAVVVVMIHVLLHDQVEMLLGKDLKLEDQFPTYAYNLHDGGLVDSKGNDMIDAPSAASCRPRK